MTASQDGPSVHQHGSSKNWGPQVFAPPGEEGAFDERQGFTLRAWSPGVPRPGGHSPGRMVTLFPLSAEFA